MGVSKEFIELDNFFKSLNASFLVLILKKGGAEDLRDFRPINLEGGLYKWLVKVLAIRFKKVVGKVASKAQSAQILDVVLIANEAINSILKSNDCSILCKLDIEKAYNHVDWSLLLLVMQKMGFAVKSIELIKWCISIISFSILVNDIPSGFYQMLRGLG